MRTHPDPAFTPRHRHVEGRTGVDRTHVAILIALACIGGIMSAGEELAGLFGDVAMSVEEASGHASLSSPQPHS